MTTELVFDPNKEGIREMSQLLAELQSAGVIFSIDRSGIRYVIRIANGNEA